MHVLAIACVANWAACIRSGHRRDEHGITLTRAWALTDPTPLPTDGPFSPIDAIGDMTLSSFGADLANRATHHSFRHV